MRSMNMREKVKTALIVIVVTVGVAGFVYYLGVRAIGFMVKMHGG